MSALLVACLNPMPDDFPNGRGGTSGDQTGSGGSGGTGTGTGAGYAGGAGSGGSGVANGASGGGGTGAVIDEDEPDTGAPEQTDAGAPPDAGDAGDAGGGAP